MHILLLTYNTTISSYTKYSWNCEEVNRLWCCCNLLTMLNITPQIQYVATWSRAVVSKADNTGCISAVCDKPFKLP